MTAPPRSSRVLIGVSVTSERARALREHGPRRDFDALASNVNGTLIYQSQPTARRGLLGRLSGPHMMQAWRMARRTGRGDVIFADGEHIGLPLLCFLQVLFRHPARVVMLGHLPGRWWKRLAFACLTRAGIGGVVLVHSVEQQRMLRGWLGRGWSVEAIPYQVDTAFWTASNGEAASCPPAGDEQPLLLAVGAEHRDYETLARAVDGLPVRVLIAAGSHWARSAAGLDEPPQNVEYLDHVLDFDALRRQYRLATAVVVPLHDVPNQSGITTILEAMSLGLPVIVTATRGQRECVTGPLIHGDGTVDAAATLNRGPHLFDLFAPAAAGGTHAEATGLYVAPGDTAGLRLALQMVVADARLRARLGTSGARVARRTFTLERFVAVVTSYLVLAPAVAASRPVQVEDLT